MTNKDSDLLERARAGDRDAHAILYRTHASMVYTLACRMLGSAPLAEDILQDCFVEVIRKVRQYRGEGDIAAWIRRIAVNKCVSHLRSPWARRRISDDRDGLELAVSAHGSDELPSAQGIDRELDRQMELESALRSLSAPARAVVWLYCVEGYTHQEIGKLMGRSTSYS